MSPAKRLRPHSSALCQSYKYMRQNINWICTMPSPRKEFWSLSMSFDYGNWQAKDRWVSVPSIFVPSIRSDCINWWAAQQGQLGVYLKLWGILFFQGHFFSAVAHLKSVGRNDCYVIQWHLALGQCANNLAHNIDPSNTITSLICLSCQAFLSFSIIYIQEGKSAFWSQHLVHQLNLSVLY